VAQFGLVVRRVAMAPKYRYHEILLREFF